MAWSPDSKRFALVGLPKGASYSEQVAVYSLPKPLAGKCRSNPRIGSGKRAVSLQPIPYPLNTVTGESRAAILSKGGVLEQSRGIRPFQSSAIRLYSGVPAKPRTASELDGDLTQYDFRRGTNSTWAAFVPSIWLLENLRKFRLGVPNRRYSGQPSKTT